MIYWIVRVEGEISFTFHWFPLFFLSSFLVLVLFHLFIIDWSWIILWRKLHPLNSIHFSYCECTYQTIDLNLNTNFTSSWFNFTGLNSLGILFNFYFYNSILILFDVLLSVANSFLGIHPVEKVQHWPYTTNLFKK